MAYIGYPIGLRENDNDEDICLTVIFQDNLGKLVRKCLHSGFYRS